MSARGSSSGQTVNAIAAWLNRVLGSRLPTLPFHGLGAVLTRLWSLIVPGPLPDPDAALPWEIRIDGALPDVLPGTKVVLKDLSIRVESTTPPLSSPHPAWPPASPPRPRRKGMQGQPAATAETPDSPPTPRRPEP